MSEQFTMPRKLAHELLGALLNGPSLNPAGYEALKQDLAARIRAAPPDPDGERDTTLLDFLDRNLRLNMGWRVGVAPAGNLSVQSVIGSKTTIREAIVAAARQRATTTSTTTERN
ncbi:hypothetical protein ACEN9F_30445 [Duganella sp. CT11-25]|uniref:hypothetical protein n=1 Tax=unclassified Duganella TaxID=2636909 RepID=UPI0039B07A91